MPALAKRRSAIALCSTPRPRASMCSPRLRAQALLLEGLTFDVERPIARGRESERSARPDADAEPSLRACACERSKLQARLWLQEFE